MRSEAPSTRLGRSAFTLNSTFGLRLSSSLAESNILTIAVSTLYKWRMTSTAALRKAHENAFGKSPASKGLWPIKFSAKQFKGEWFIVSEDGEQVWSPNKELGGFTEVCKICRKFDCYLHCQKTVDGQHEASGTSAQQVSGNDFTVDYNCKHCGQSGGVLVDPDDIQWG